MYIPLRVTEQNAVCIKRAAKVIILINSGWLKEYIIREILITLPAVVSWKQKRYTSRHELTHAHLHTASYIQ